MLVALLRVLLNPLLRSACPAALLVLFVGGCYGSDSPGGDDGGDAHLDAATGAADGGYERRDCGVSPEGLALCSYEARGCLGCLCWLVESDGGQEGLCITSPDAFGSEELCTVSSGCSERTFLCHDLGNTVTDGHPIEGICVSTDACEVLRERGDSSRCYYEDGSVYRSGEVPATSCRPEHAGIVCGPGCGECAPGRDCFGVSERSGLGLCMDAPVTTSIDRCGTDYDECSGSESCVRFVVPESDAVTAAEVSGACVPTASCRELEVTYPERFRCPEAS